MILSKVTQPAMFLFAHLALFKNVSAINTNNIIAGSISIPQRIEDLIKPKLD